MGNDALLIGAALVGAAYFLSQKPLVNVQPLPNVSINTPLISIPEFKLPDFKIPEITWPGIPILGDLFGSGGISGPLPLTTDTTYQQRIIDLFTPATSNGVWTPAGNNMWYNNSTQFYQWFDNNPNVR